MPNVSAALKEPLTAQRPFGPFDDQLLADQRKSARSIGTGAPAERCMSSRDMSDYSHKYQRPQT